MLTKRLGYTCPRHPGETVIPQVIALRKQHVRQEDCYVEINPHERTALTRCHKALRPGDELILCSLQSLAMSTEDTVTFLDLLLAQSVHIISLEDGINTRERPEQLAVFIAIASITKAAAAPGPHSRKRHKSLTIEQQTHLNILLNRMNPVDIVAKHFGISRRTVFRYAQKNRSHAHEP